jgi:hypothetical protein
MPPWINGVWTRHFFHLSIDGRLSMHNLFFETFINFFSFFPLMMSSRYQGAIIMGKDEN